MSLWGQKLKLLFSRELPSRLHPPIPLSWGPREPDESEQESARVPLLSPAPLATPRGLTVQGGTERHQSTEDNTILRWYPSTALGGMTSWFSETREAPRGGRADKEGQDRCHRVTATGRWVYRCL